MACGLIASLLPSLAAAQDWSTLESRKAWFIEQNRDVSINPNGKFAPAIALARLALNPDDAKAISSIATFYDKVGEDGEFNQFNLPGVAYVLGKYWEKFTPAQRDHLKAKLKGESRLLGHGIENHAIMKCVAAYLFAQYWPNETGWLQGDSISILQHGDSDLRGLVLDDLTCRGDQGLILYCEKAHALQDITLRNIDVLVNHAPVRPLERSIIDMRPSPVIERPLPAFLLEGADGVRIRDCRAGFDGKPRPGFSTGHFEVINCKNVDGEVTPLVGSHQ
jgi:hypothetical protein